MYTDPTCANERANQTQDALVLGLPPPTESQTVVRAPRTYEDYTELEKDYVEGSLHPGDLKPALTKAINNMLQVPFALPNWLEATLPLQTVNKILPVCLVQSS